MEEEKTTTEVVETSPATPAESPVTSEKPKNNKGLIATTIIACVLAVAGITGAIYFYLDANSKTAETAKLKAELNLVKQETGAEIVEKEENSGTISVVETSYKNPVIKSDQNTGYIILSTLKWSAPTDGGVEQANLQVRIENGEITSCELYKDNEKQGDCSITGLEGNIYKAVDFLCGNGVNSDCPAIAFIMEDGSVNYLSSFKASSGDYSVENSKFEKKVIDIVSTNSINLESKVGGGYVPYFIFEDGTYIKYSPSATD